MIYFPTCKLNLGLQVLRKREDGYHDIASVLLELPFTDVLELVRSEDFSFQLTGVEWNEDPNKNSCVMAYNLLKQHNPSMNSYAMHLHKCIPTGAGLGGGSADSSFVLRALNELECLGYTNAELESFAAQLGSDNAFFIRGGMQFSWGRGELLEPMDASLLNGYWVYLVNFGYHVSTAQAYSGVIPKDERKSIQNVLQQPISTWKQELENDFEQSVFQLHPSLEKAKELLYSHGACYAAMSGSGSTMFGIFEAEKKINWSEEVHVERWLQL